MDPAKAKAWQRFFDEVVAQGSRWPRTLWFAAVDDALMQALGPDSELVAGFRRDLAELTQLERAARNSYEDEKRIAALEAAIRERIEAADAEIMQAVAASGDSEDESQETISPTPAAVRASGGAGLSRAFRTAAFTLLILGTGLLAGVYLYDARLAHQVDRQIGDRLDQLHERMRVIEGDVAERTRTVVEQAERLAAKHAALDAKMVAFESRVAASLDQMTALHDDVIGEIERQLAERSGEVDQLLARLRERESAARRGLDAIDQTVARLERRLPEISGDLAGLSERVEQGQAAIGESVEEIAILRSLAPELIDWVRTERAELEEAAEAEQMALRELETRITALKGRFKNVDADLDAFQSTIEEGVEQAKTESEVLKTTIDELKTTGGVVAELVAGAEADIATAQEQAEERIDSVLAGLAEKADFAAMRGDDVLGRAEEQASARIEATREHAIAALDDLRAQELRAIREEAQALRTELEGTGGGLIASWRGMDRRVTEHHDALLADLDGYAKSVEARVKELVDAIDIAGAPAPADPAEVATSRP